MSRGWKGARRAGAIVLALALSLGAAAPRSAAAEAARDSTARDSSAVRRAPRDSTARFVPADSLPSDDARAVLRTIPEPLPPGETVPVDSSALALPARTFPAPDTLAADTTGVPTPAITAPLGENPDAPRRSAVLDTTTTAPPATSPPSSPSPPATIPAALPPAAAPAADTCWRVQIAAYGERPVAEAHRVAAASQLLVPMAIENENGRLKIRTSECLTRSAAESLKRRAFDSGFPGAFLIRMGANGEAIPVGSPPPAAAPKKAAVKRTSATPRGAVRAATTPVRKKSVARK